MFNLLANAFKYTPDNGTISFSAECAAGMLQFSVADTGIGISSDEIDRVFDNFYQVEKIRPNGSGIGLWLSRSLVEMHGGRIEIRSTQGKGSVFTVEIPVRHVSEEVSGAEPMISSEDIATELSAIEGLAMVSHMETRQRIVLTSQLFWWINQTVARWCWLLMTARICVCLSQNCSKMTTG